MSSPVQQCNANQEDLLKDKKLDLGVGDFCPLCKDLGADVKVGFHKSRAAAPAVAAAAASSSGHCSQCSCQISRVELQEQKENAGHGLQSLDDLCPAMTCRHPVSSHYNPVAKHRRRSGGESSEGSEGGVAVPPAATHHSASFDSFLSALDAAPPLPGTALPFSPTLTYLPLVQQAPHAAQPAILGDRKDGSRLFVRSSYAGLWQLIAQQRQKVDARSVLSSGALITGNAGVGKSVFLAYVIKQLRALAAPPTIVYHDISAKKCFVMHPGRATAEKFKNVDSDMVDDPAVVYLVDIGGTAEHGPLKCAAFTIVVASPHAKSKDILRNWHKHAKFPPVWYMPCWSEEELQACRRVVAPSDAEQATDQLLGVRLLAALSVVTVTQRVQRFGGIARVAFCDDSTLPQLNDLLQSAVKSCDLEVVASQAGGDLDLLPESSSWLLHYVVDVTTFKLANIVFASEPILQEVWQRFGSGQNDKVLRFIDATSRNPTWSGARGNLFEPLAHEWLQAGGTFSVQQFADPLTTKKKGERGKRVGAPVDLVISASPLPPQPVSTAAAISSLAPLQYGQPDATNFATIDGVLKPNMLFQMTVSLSHDVNIDGLNAAVAALQLSPAAAAVSPPRLYFVLPPQQFATFQLGAFTSSVKPVPTAAATIPAAVEYWALQLYSASAAPGKRKAAAAGVSSPPPPKAAHLAVTATTMTTTTAAAAATPLSVCCDCFDGCKKGTGRTGKCPCRRADQACHAGCHTGAAPASAPTCGNRN